MPAREKNNDLCGSLVSFEDIDDTPSSINRLETLMGVLSISELAVLCGADGPMSIRGWAAIGQQFEVPMTCRD